MRPFIIVRMAAVKRGTSRGQVRKGLNHLTVHPFNYSPIYSELGAVILMAFCMALLFLAWMGTRPQRYFAELRGEPRRPPIKAPNHRGIRPIHHTWNRPTSNYEEEEEKEEKEELDPHYQELKPGSTSPRYSSRSPSPSLGAFGAFTWPCPYSYSPPPLSPPPSTTANDGSMLARIPINN